MGLGGITTSRFTTPSVSGGLSEVSDLDPEAVLNLDIFRTSGRRLRAGSDADVTDVTAVPAVTRRDRRDYHDCRDHLSRHEHCHVWFFFTSPFPSCSNTEQS